MATWSSMLDWRRKPLVPFPGFLVTCGSDTHVFEVLGTNFPE